MKNYTDINIIVDRSGSMSNIADDMVGGLRTFVKEQQDRKDAAKVSYFIFDDQYDVVFQNKDLAEVKSEDFKLVPRGWTALNDALGKTMNAVGERLAAMPEDDRPNRVLFVVITDGADNRSKEFPLEKLKEMVKHQREVYAWDFVFLGANIDSFSTGGGLGIGAASTANFVASRKGVNEAFRTLSDDYTLYSATVDRNVNRSATFTVSNKPTSEENT